eukprot:TRINITY_DN6679_c0_g1_i1.p1 TRINITY_DN6679_c0_g1~~TRINITY_DN6679_c0_g1_i1.p1  ORF type:complete len:669 (-),score=276.33 TRINITY_DN6679_c0_g1_i1:85-2091(-)
MTDPVFWLKPESGENPWIPLELNKQVSIGRRDVVAEEARPINSISRVQAVVTAASKNSVQLKQCGGNTMYLTTGDHSEPLKLSADKEYMLKLGDRISLSGKCYIYRVVAPHESRDLTRSTSTLAPEVYSDDTDREDEARDIAKLGNDPQEAARVKQSLTPTDEVSSAVLQQDRDAKNSDSEHKTVETEPKTQKGKKRKSRKDTADDVAEDEDWDPTRDKKKRKKDSSTNKESDSSTNKASDTPSRGTRPQRARVTWISKYVDQIALRGYSFSERHKLAILYDEACLTHIVPEWHLEKPERLKYILSGIEELRRVVDDKLMVVKLNDLPNLASDQLSQIHSEAYLSKMKARVSRSLSLLPQHGTQLSQEQSRDSEQQDTFVSRHSLDAALASASAVCRAVDIVLADHVPVAEQFDSQSNTQPDSLYTAPLDDELAEVRHVFCAVRPPGHHAGHSGHAQAQSQGFCLINNVAVGVNYALNRGLTRVVIYDFDVHHGNGTEDIMATNARFKDHVLFISSHCSEIYPHTGVNSPAKNILNVPLKNRSTSAQFRKAFKEKILTAIDEYKPELIMLSAGFDAFKDDPVQCLRLDESDYAYMTEELKALAVKHCAGRLISVLEGGYDLDSLQRCVQVHLTHLMTGCAMDDKMKHDNRSVNENNSNVIVSETSMPE